MAGNAGEVGRSVTSKVTAILLSFAGAPVYSLTEIAQLTGLPVTTTHRLLGELTAARVLDRTTRGDYRLGLPMTMLQSEPAARCGVEQWAPQVVEDLAEATRRPVRLGVLRDLRVAHIEKVDRRPVTTFDAGATLPVHATAAGKALLAFTPAATVESVIARGLPRYTDRTVTRPEHLRTALAAVRLARLAVSDGELHAGEFRMAVPVVGRGGSVVAALEVHVRKVRTELEQVQRMLVLAARSLSRELTSDGAAARFAYAGSGAQAS